MAKTGTLTSRMEMRVDDSFIATVTELANLTQQSKAEVLRDALNLYYKAVKEYEENGKGIVFQVIEQSQGSSKTTAEKTGKPLCTA